MIRRPPRSTRTDTLFPYTTLFRSRSGADCVSWHFHLPTARDLAHSQPKRCAPPTKPEITAAHQQYDGNQVEDTPDNLERQSGIITKIPTLSEIHNAQPPPQDRHACQLCRQSFYHHRLQTTFRHQHI